MTSRSDYEKLIDEWIFKEKDRAYARGRGRNAKRDSMGRYASDGYSRSDEMRDLTHEIKMMANYLPANKQQDLQRLVDKMEQM